ncbi:MAG: APC family permease [Phycisphaerae bacterium]
MVGEPLRRMIGQPTAWLVGIGVAIGSGIFRTPGSVAAALTVRSLILAAWLVGGLIVLMQGMVTAELATRHPKAGGEYVFLKEAYGAFAAFLFGWGYTVFILGGGVAAIMAALGDFACALFGWSTSWSGPVAAIAVIVVIAVNAAGLRTGAGVQNVLTLIKIGALAAVAVIGITMAVPDAGVGAAHVAAAGDGATAVDVAARGAASAVAMGPHDWSLLAFIGALIPVLWAYDGTTDAVKLSEEIKDVRRVIPRAVIGSTLALIGLYLLVNYGLLRIVPPADAARFSSVPGEAMGRVFGAGGRRVMLVVAIIVCLGSAGATVLASIRVTFALARDGLAFRFLARMSRGQAPVPALMVVGTVAVVLVLTRRFEDVLGIYFFASAVLFGLSYASLIVFRVRERGIPDGVYRCPMGSVLAAMLVAIQIALMVHIARTSPADTLGTVGLLVVLGVLYRFRRAPSGTAEP